MPTYVNGATTTTQSNSVGTQTLTVTYTNSAGNALFIAFCSASIIGTPTVSDTAGNIWSVEASTFSIPPGAVIAYVLNAKTATSVTVTWQSSNAGLVSGAGSAALAIAEYSGAQGALFVPYAQNNTAAPTNSTLTLSTSSLTGALFIGGFLCQNENATTSWTTPVTGTQRQATAVVNCNTGLVTDYFTAAIVDNTSSTVADTATNNSAILTSVVGAGIVFPSSAPTMLAYGLGY
jgi:hypothetical protein